MGQLRAARDFKKDGNLDLATANYSGNVGVLLGKGDGTFQSVANYDAASSNLYGITVGDWNGRGKLDLATANSGGNDVSLLLGTGTFQAARSYVAGGGPAAAVGGDWNGDGRLDLTVANGTSSNVSVLLYSGCL